MFWPQTPNSERDVRFRITFCMISIGAYSLNVRCNQKHPLPVYPSVYDLFAVMFHNYSWYKMTNQIPILSLIHHSYPFCSQPPPCVLFDGVLKTVGWSLNKPTKHSPSCRFLCICVCVYTHIKIHAQRTDQCLLFLHFYRSKKEADF